VTPWGLEALAPVWQARIGVLREGYALAAQDVREQRAQEQAEAARAAAQAPPDPYEEIITRE
jgi:hypothetical protein